MGQVFGAAGCIVRRQRRMLLVTWPGHTVTRGLAFSRCNAFLATSWLRPLPLLVTADWRTRHTRRANRMQSSAAGALDACAPPTTTIGSRDRSRCGRR